MIRPGNEATDEQLAKEKTCYVIENDNTLVDIPCGNRDEATCNSICDEIKKSDLKYKKCGFDNGRKCLIEGTPGWKRKGTYGPWNTKFYFPRERKCDGTDSDNCLEQGVANDDVEHKLLEFIDITNIKVNGIKSSYTFNCKNGKEVKNSKNGRKYFNNGKKGTLCHMLSKPNPCEGFGKGWDYRKVYEANGCDNEADCKVIKGVQSNKLDSRIQVAVYLNEEGIMSYELGLRNVNQKLRRRRLFESLKYFNKKSANQRRRRLLQNGGRRC